MTKTPWFRRSKKPARPGVYLTHNTASLLDIKFWRAFDGKYWRVGIIATNSNGIILSESPAYEDACKYPRLSDHITLEWCGLVEESK